MTNYDINKVSPRPWYYLENIEAGSYSCQCSMHDADGDVLMLSFDGEAHTVLKGTNAKHVIHAVNMHDELVEALEECRDMFSDNAKKRCIESLPYRSLMNRIFALLSRAKGGKR